MCVGWVGPFPSWTGNVIASFPAMVGRVRFCRRQTLKLHARFPLHRYAAPELTKAQELIDKSPQMPDDVVWHFIGHLQSKKAKALVAGVPNLEVVETLDTTKLADKLQVTITRFVGEAGKRSGGSNIKKKKVQIANTVKIAYI